MSIQTLRDQLKDIPGAERMVMHYADGGASQMFLIEGMSVKVGPDATTEEIRAAFLEAMKE